MTAVVTVVITQFGEYFDAALATSLPGALPLWCYPAGLLTWRQVAQALQRHGLAHRDALGACRGSGSALEVISCPYIKNTNHLKELYISKNP